MCHQLNQVITQDFALMTQINYTLRAVVFTGYHLRETVTYLLQRKWVGQMQQLTVQDMVSVFL